MNPPPSWLLWTTSFLSIILGSLQLWQHWKKRERIQFTQIVAKQYYSVFSERDEKAWDYLMIRPKAGDPKRVFVVLEFSITNNFSRSISVGRFNVGGWMFSDEYQRGIYDHIRDYRVYDLYSDKRISLDSYRIIEPGATIGFRIEAFERSGDGGNRSRRYVEMPSSYKMDLQTDVGRRQYEIKNIDLDYLEREDYFKYIFRLSKSELVPNYEPIGGEAVPQGVTHPYRKTSYKLRLKRYIQNRKYHYFGKTKSDEQIHQERIKLQKKKTKE